MAKAKYTKRADGRFYTTYWDGTYTSSGKKHRAPVYSTKSSADLEKKVNKLKSEVSAKLQQEDPDIEKDMDTYLYAKEWFDLKKGNKAKNTKEMYLNSIERYIVKLSGVSLRRITNSHFQFILTSAQAHPRSCEQLKLCFKQIMKSAARDHYYKKSDLEDLFSDLSTPKYVPRERRALTAAEKKAIQEADFTNRERTYVYIVYGCGLRRGEAIALTPFDVDLKRRVIKVTKAVEFDVNDPYLKDTKNHKDREVPLPDFLHEWMLKHRLDSPQYLISKSNGGLMTKSSYDKMWEQIKKKIFSAKEKEVFETLEDYDLTSHFFRHNYCASLCYQVPKISIKKIADLLGDSEKMVLEVYNHVIEDNEKVNEAVQSAVNF